jgi:hypothetical protein
MRTIQDRDRGAGRLAARRRTVSARYSFAALKVSHADGLPLVLPTVNQCWRSADEP